MTARLGYEKYEGKGRNSGNSRNLKTSRKRRTSNGDLDIGVPGNRNGDCQSKVLAKHRTRSSELEAKIVALYAKALSTRDIQATLEDLYGVDVSAATISAITDKVWALVESWQNRPRATIDPIVSLDAIHLADALQRRHPGGVSAGANPALYHSPDPPQLKYVGWKDREAFVAELKTRSTVRRHAKLPKARGWPSANVGSRSTRWCARGRATGTTWRPCLPTRRKSAD